MRILSVDLGTSNTVAVLSAHGMPPRVVEVDGSATMPSAVFAGEDGTLLVGRDAERRARLDPARFEPNPKRRVDEQTLLLGQDVVPVNETLAAVLRRVLEETTRQLGGEQPDQLRLTHPAEWGPLRRNVLLTSARLAGFTGPVQLVPEPVAAAAHFASFPGRALAPGQALAVYDLGAGTFDVAVVGATQNGFTVLAEDGLPDLGGLDVDQALMVHVGREVSHRDPQRWQRLLRPESTADRRTRRALQEDVKAAKEALSRLPQTEVPMPEPFTDVLVTRGELEALVRPALLRSVELLARTVASAGLTPDRLAGIYLVGGSSRLPLVGSMIAEKLGVVPVSLDQPETAVAFGAHHVSPDGISMRTQNVDGQVAAGPQYVPPPAAPRFPYPASFPSYPAPAPPKRSRKKPLIAVAVAVVVLLAAGLTYLLWPAGSAATTYSAEECGKPGQVDAQGFTGCLRQLAGSIATTSQCAAGAGSGDIAPPEGQDLGVLTTCSAPALAGAQITYVHANSAAALKEYTGRLLSSVGGDQVQAPWRGNALSGTYSAAGGKTSAVLVFTVTDRPLAGVVYQRAGSGQTASSASELADYFERTVQPGT
ncbi:actin-like ATPase involved in cell morphogenesis [Amycolatopsis bartoniae]|uniref:Molecular chaperone Hsp70 n=1 Tax=Amycolatopsis bartoniae TaxID=941986 RepID=A0A8H9MEA7_9PSEU|nr:Hsp70 family protein [Amycolatopsis bartoniae]MBB2933973.1 actin-like ATPase involved in cell morphogenesis [Amycolatopsis bartoniae]TVT02803.1 Hsp70 family protein [Amycolatopsis bartoniae]GHF86219.1 molecular chaperone Hsp70 [Amycolatopsis bartoniae]